MATLDGPDKGGPEDRDATNKDGRWIDIRKRCKSALVRGKGGGKGSSEHGNDMQTQVQSQGRERTATENDFFERHKMHKALYLSPMQMVHLCQYRTSLTRTLKMKSD